MRKSGIRSNWYRQVMISESFTARNNKRKTAGSGEARLYIGSKKEGIDQVLELDPGTKINANQKQYAVFRLRFVVAKRNLIQYMREAKPGYETMAEEVDTIGDMLELYKERLRIIESLPEFVKFNCFDQSSTKDKDRSYIGSASKIWKLLREISLPKNTMWVISKVWDETVGEFTVQIRLIYLKDGSNEQFLYQDLGYVDESLNILEFADEQIIEDVNDNRSLSESERTAIVQARIGQGKFREDVLEKMPRCPFTGISEPYLLRASHSLPWRECDSYSDRLDPFNGLALSPTYDVLYDRGYISINEKGFLLVADQVTEELRDKLNLKPGMRILSDEDRLDLRSRFLRYHAKYVFLDGDGGDAS